MSIVCFIIRCYNSSTNTAQVYNEIPYSLVQVRQCAVRSRVARMIEIIWLFNTLAPRSVQ